MERARRTLFPVADGAGHPGPVYGDAGLPLPEDADRAQHRRAGIVAGDGDTVRLAPGIRVAGSAALPARAGLRVGSRREGAAARQWTAHAFGIRRRSRRMERER